MLACARCQKISSNHSQYNDTDSFCFHYNQRTIIIMIFYKSSGLKYSSKLVHGHNHFDSWKMLTISKQLFKILHYICQWGKIHVCAYILFYMYQKIMINRKELIIKWFNKQNKRVPYMYLILISALWSSFKKKMRIPTDTGTAFRV